MKTCFIFTLCVLSQVMGSQNPAEGSFDESVTGSARPGNNGLNGHVEQPTDGKAMADFLSTHPTNEWPQWAQEALKQVEKEKKLRNMRLGLVDENGNPVVHM